MLNAIGLRLVFCLFALSGSGAYASELSRCQDLDPRKLFDGERCLTSTGFEFKLIRRTRLEGYEVWQDVTTKLLWSDRLRERYPYVRAMDVCLSKDQEKTAKGNLPRVDYRLPSHDEFQTAHDHGFREVLKDATWMYWSATLVDDPDVGHNGGWVFNGAGTGGFYAGYWGASTYPLNVRCVGQFKGRRGD